MVPGCVPFDFKAKMNKSKINKYKINNNNKTNTKHEFNVRYERYKQDISKDTLQMQSTNLQKFAVILLYQQIKLSLLRE
jgi:site-specific DNA-adenine methylase